MKLVDPRGEMLEASWEGHATTLANAATTQDFIAALENIVKTTKIDLSKPARVVYARDTRPSGAALVASLEDGIKAMGAEARNGGVTTTPILHYYVRAMNTKGTKDAYGEDTEDGYFTKLSTAFGKLVVSLFSLHVRGCIFDPRSHSLARPLCRPLPSTVPTASVQKASPKSRPTLAIISNLWLSTPPQRPLTRSTMHVAQTMSRHPRNFLLLLQATSNLDSVLAVWTATRTG